jgi:SAM-dependent methyltransferase
VLVSGDHECPTCRAGGPGDVIAALDACWVTAPVWAPLPGYVRVVARTHGPEPFDLGGLERRRYWDEVLLTAEAIRDGTGAESIGYETHGDPRCHLHTHLYPRYPGDPFAGGPIDARARLFERTSDDIESLAAAVRPAGGAPRRPAPPGPAWSVYDEMASWFERQSATGFYNAGYDRPAVLGLAGPVDGQRIVDLGCGAGHYLEALIDGGASVVGVDGSAELLDRARTRAGGRATLIRHDLNLPLSMLGDADFDGAILALVYHHIDNRPGLLADVHRILRPDGWLVVSTSHPMSDWLEHGGSYFSVERVTAVFDRQGGRWEVPYWRLPLANLLAEILDAGFRLERLVEPVPEPQSRGRDPRLFARLEREPAFLALRARLQ